MFILILNVINFFYLFIKMVGVREGLLKNGFDFSNYVILEMVQSYWTEVSNLKRNTHYKYY